jgi:hypothetical protein
MGCSLCDLIINQSVEILLKDGYEKSLITCIQTCNLGCIWIVVFKNKIKYITTKFLWKECSQGKKKTPFRFFFFKFGKNKNQKQTLKDDIYAKQQGCEINVTTPSFTEQLRWPDIFSPNIVMCFFLKYCNLKLNMLSRQSIYVFRFNLKHIPKWQYSTLTKFHQF